MDFDFSKVRVPTSSPSIVHPVELFHSLTIGDTAINDLWLAQGDALRDWHEHRDDSDVAIALNTGAGKTLIGLLIAQSLLNELQTPVAYACASIQLVTQTAEKATGYGLPVATYHSRNFVNRDAYVRADMPCITTYQALLNGKSRFTRDHIGAVVFDDAHTAEHILREQFTLQISRQTKPDVYNALWAMFKEYHHHTGSASSYQEMYDQVNRNLFLIPPHEVKRQASQMRQVLRTADLTRDTETMFAWEHIRDHEDLCCVLVTEEAISLTPPVIPNSSLSLFASSVRRVYLSATLTAPDAMVRAFGREPSHIVSPSTTAGECERMILFPSAANESDGELATAKRMITEQKALILVPSFGRGDEWSDVSEMPKGDAATEAIRRFRDAETPTHLTLASRYDGIDLPGDSCRVMVMDGLPTGTGVLERFQWERLEMENTLKSILASRIVQSFGRISRGLSDHGVVLITGRDLLDWLAMPRNRGLLPRFLQQQIALGENLCEQASKGEALDALVSSCLNRSPGWLEFYSQTMQETEARSPEPDRELALRIALAEAKFGEYLWLREYEHAVAALSGVLEEAFEFSPNAGGWSSLWIGYAADMAGDTTTATEFYAKAETAHRNIPRSRRTVESQGSDIPEQVQQMAQQMQVNLGSNSISLPPRGYDASLAPLLGGASSSRTEEALRMLGQFLGLASTRPDKEYGTGPDVLWHLDGHTALCMELKTDKQDESTYTKADVGQLHNHVQWVKGKLGDVQVIPIFVGPELPFREEASPSLDMRIVQVDRFQEVANDLAALYQSVASSLPLYLRTALHQGAEERGLLYSTLLSRLGGSGA